ncbi:hypothetical protein BDP27DRAFT_1402685 [Rhodocollybia butyracea]|uniref:Uncharacterized protein n=1 Tax=Rhodocollybia butyracea TaxID=206335 RepID=A0A9P5U7U3_9AGAR|nr:hypothetical protein BDP27DRAFT_1402685 [Rhodocollybia butyracea]
MLFTIPYASVLLVASLSCIWATPIAVNRDTLTQQRSESDLRSRVMEIGSLEARGLGFNSLSARGDVHAIHGRADRGEPMGARQPKAVKDFKFVRRVYPVTAVDSGNVASEVENFLGRALPYVIIPSHQTLSEWYQKHADALPASEDYFIVEFIFKLDNMEYQGVLVNPLKRPEEDGIVTETRGILYKERSRVYPPPPLSLMPGDQLRPLRLMVLNLEYKPVYTGYWITAFTFTKKINLDQSTADRDAKEIATQAQTLLARALPHVEVFGITANLYNRPSKHHPPHSLDVKSVEFTFQLLIESKEGTNSYLDVMEYRGVLINPLERSDHEGACFKRTIKKKTKPEGAYHSYVDSVKQIGSPPHDEVRVTPDIDLKPVKPQ